MVQGMISVFEQDINKDEQVLPNHTVSVVKRNSGDDEPHVALNSATTLFVNSESGGGTLVGWVGPLRSSSCTATQTLLRGLNQVQLSYGCTDPGLSSKDQFPVQNGAFGC